MAGVARDILVLQTGGTIDKMYPQKMGAYAFEIGEPAVARIFDRISPGFTFDMKKICTKDSQEITDADRDEMIRTIKETKQSHVLITHGTDTLCDTANYLSDKCVGMTSSCQTGVSDKMVVMTGSFKPESIKDTDADFNIGFALGLLRSMPKTGVFVAIGGQVFDGSRVVRKGDGKFIEERSIGKRQ